MSKCGCCSNGEWAGETAHKSNFRIMRKVNEQPLRISTAVQSKPSFWELASGPCTTFCISIANNKMVDNLNSSVNEIQHITDSFGLKHGYVLCFCFFSFNEAL